MPAYLEFRMRNKLFLLNTLSVTFEISYYVLEKQSSVG